MTGFVLEYLQAHGAFASSMDEQMALTASVKMYLEANGVREDATQPFYRRYLRRQMGKIAAADLKAFFLAYPAIRDVRQRVVQFEAGRPMTESGRRELYGLMTRLYECGLGERYVPAAQVERMLNAPPPAARLQAGQGCRQK